MLVFLHVDSRRVFISPATRKPNSMWVAGQAEAFVEYLHATGRGPAGTILIRDRDGKYAPEFDQVLQRAGVTVRRTQPRSPNLQAHVQKWIQSVRVERMDKFIPLGEMHRNYLVREYVEHRYTERPHQSKDNRPLPDADCPDPPVLPFPERIECKKRLVGVLKHHRRAA